jgi:hypothetical protein
MFEPADLLSASISAELSREMPAGKRRLPNQNGTRRNQALTILQI